MYNCAAGKERDSLPTYDPLEKVLQISFIDALNILFLIEVIELKPIGVGHVSLVQ